MTDRELLEAAARAAGIGVIRSRLDDPMNRDMLVSNSARNPHQRAGPWNPLTDDGDALRLAVRLGMHYVDAFPVPSLSLTQECHGDEYAATRRAIVRAAAAMEQS